MSLEEIRKHNAEVSEQSRLRGIHWRTVLLAKPHLLGAKLKRKLEKELAGLKSGLH